MTLLGNSSKRKNSVELPNWVLEVANGLPPAIRKPLRSITNLFALTHESDFLVLKERSSKLGSIKEDHAKKKTHSKVQQGLSDRERIASGHP